MAVTAETRTSLIGLSVVMLGSAPGTDRLNDWVNAINDGMSWKTRESHREFRRFYPPTSTPSDQTRIRTSFPQQPAHGRRKRAGGGLSDLGCPS